MHKNMFSYGATSDEVYQAFQRDSKRDGKVIQFMDLFVVAAVIYLLRDLSGWDFAAALIVVFVSIQRLNYFIDQSNRNFLMHWIDWQRAREPGGDS